MSIYEEKRPWGGFRQFTHNEQTTVKLLTIKEGQQFSLQTHAKRKEFWRVLSGTAELTVGEKILLANPGDEFEIEVGQKHRAKGVGGDVLILEIAFGDFEEGDIERLSDDYGRS